MDTTSKIIDVRDKISNHLKENGIMQSWLANKLNISGTHISLIFKKERDLIEKNRTAINELLGTDF